MSPLREREKSHLPRCTSQFVLPTEPHYTLENKFWWLGQHTQIDSACSLDLLVSVSWKPADEYETMNDDSVKWRSAQDWVEAGVQVVLCSFSVLLNTLEVQSKNLNQFLPNYGHMWLQHFWFKTREHQYGMVLLQRPFTWEHKRGSTFWVRIIPRGRTQAEKTFLYGPHSVHEMFKQ